LVLEAVKLREFFGDEFIVVKGNRVVVDICLDSIDNWHWIFLFVKSIQLPMFGIFVKPWFILEFVYDVYVIIALITNQFNIVINIIIYV
jgi:hypothetical protein